MTTFSSQVASELTTQSTEQDTLLAPDTVFAVDEAAFEPVEADTAQGFMDIPLDVEEKTDQDPDSCNSRQYRSFYRLDISSSSATPTLTGGSMKCRMKAPLVNLISLKCNLSTFSFKNRVKH
ncbi:hypothetical protein [uncultured Desulfobacter sp.]|uniref:hypothetical protein n=1 Tax=uncultured Desulfobacter sp. TaxID=240139 RepID=UPI0029F5A1FA|nr:hypothetical protein [uncultured Desulfobacter sp.]